MFCGVGCYSPSEANLHRPECSARKISRQMHLRTRCRPCDGLETDQLKIKKKQNKRIVAADVDSFKIRCLWLASGSLMDSDLRRSRSADCGGSFTKSRLISLAFRPFFQLPLHVNARYFRQSKGKNQRDRVHSQSRNGLIKVDNMRAENCRAAAAANSLHSPV